MTNILKKQKLTKTLHKVVSGPKQILVRMQFTNKKFLLDSVPLHHWSNAKKLIKKAKNNVEPGTRTEAKSVCIKQFFAYLLKSPIYYITDIHCHRVAKDSTKYVVVIMFSSFGKPFRKVSRSDLKKLNQLAFLDAWKHIKYDRNKNGVWSLTCCHRIPNSQIEDGEIGDLFFDSSPDDFEPDAYYEENCELI
ncbi:hypothetical protein K8R32_04325 [bacterium]|nr:hypothetical protein [bacterium]